MTEDSTVFPQVSLARIGEVDVMSLDGRELHEKLEVGKDFTDWVKQRIGEAQLRENIDYVCSPNLGSKGRGGHNRTDYVLTLDAGKHIAMLERTEKGRVIRGYFIEVENKSPQFTACGHYGFFSRMSVTAS